MTDREHRDGFVLVTFLTILIPLLVLAAAFSSAMHGRSGELRNELDQERSLLAAESGVDDAIYRGTVGLLGGGPYSRNLGAGLVFHVEPTYLKTDGKDNDADGKVDEDDEDVYQVIVTGTYRDVRRRLAAYLGPVPLLPPITSAVSVHDPDIVIDIRGSAEISGNDHTIAGAPAGGDIDGLSIAPPGTRDHLLSELSDKESSQVTGTGGSPSVATSPAIDMSDLVAQLQNIADVVLTSDKYSGYSFGNGATGEAHVTFRNGDVSFAGNSGGAGVLVVTGDLEISGNFRFDGVVVVLGRMENSAGTAVISGGILHGPDGELIQLKGTADIRFSSEAIDLANSASGRYKAYNGWQEIAR